MSQKLTACHNELQLRHCSSPRYASDFFITHHKLTKYDKRSPRFSNRQWQGWKKKEKTSLNKSKHRSKFWVKMFMYYLVLPLEMVTDLFPLVMKLDSSSLLVHQLEHQWKNFHLEWRQHMQWKMRRSWIHLLVFQQAETTMSALHSTYLWNFDKAHLSFSV